MKASEALDRLMLERDTLLSIAQLNHDDERAIVIERAPKRMTRLLAALNAIGAPFGAKQYGEVQAWHRAVADASELHDELLQAVARNTEMYREILAQSQALHTIGMNPDFDIPSGDDEEEL